jgi:hypothetical protein
MERYRTTIILVAVLAVLGGLALFLNNRGGSSSTATPTPIAQPAVWQASGDVVALKVVSGTKTVELRKDVTTTVWSLVSPVSATADPFTVGNVADQFKSLQASTVITAPADLAQYGLVNAPLQITVKSGSTPPARHELSVGIATVDGSGYYVQERGGKDVYVVGNTLIEPVKSWLDSPPKAQPTATPLPLTFAPTFTPGPATTGTPTP